MYDKFDYFLSFFGNHHVHQGLVVFLAKHWNKGNHSNRRRRRHEICWSFARNPDTGCLLLAQSRLVGWFIKHYKSSYLIILYLVSLQVNLDEAFVIVKQLGANSSALSGFALVQNKEYKAYHGDVLEILHNKYFHEIVFDPEPKTNSQTSFKSNDRVSEKPTLKRQSSPVHLVDSKKVKLSAAVGTANAEHSWTTAGSGKLLVFTAKGVISSSKVLLNILNSKFNEQN